MLNEYFLNYHAQDIRDILDATESYSYYPIYVNFVSLFEVSPETAQKILKRPRHFIPLCEQSAIEVQEEMIKSTIKENLQTVKKNIRIRITAVPVTIDQGQIGELVSTSGIIVRISQPTVLKRIKRFTCKKCKHISIAELEWETQTFRDIKECDACHSRNITTLTSLNQEDCSDYQEIKIQEKHQTDTSTSYTVGLQIILLDDLVDKCRPGDHVDISGIVIRRWGTLAPGRRTEATTIMIANSVSVRGIKAWNSLFSTREVKEMFRNYWKFYDYNPLAGRDKILTSICPQLYGMYTVKLALAVILAGGVPKWKEGTRIRGEPHLLLIGDPGTGKSQLLCAASRLAVRSVRTTGIGTTAAGLTAAAVKDTDGWHLEGGALVLADGGVCCVDEFSTMNSHDRASVHEAMEQQTVSIAKAGLVSTLNTRCTVIAAINPEGGSFADGEEWKTRLGNPLLSRFDLILLLKDNRNAEWDRLTSEHILKAACEAGKKKAQIGPKKSLDVLDTDDLWKEESLREYFSYIQLIKPVMTDVAEEILGATYLYHRSNPERRAERTTVRLLDSLIRLAEGHAKLMFRTEVKPIDAIIAADLIGTIPTDKSDTGCPFPTEPLKAYYSRGEEILKILGLRGEHYLDH